jgi:flagellar hook-associated protein 3
MRITHNMTTRSIILHLQRQTKQLFNVQTQIATQKRLNKPSDDPIGMGRVLDYRSQLASIDQYQRNIEQGKLMVETNELILDLVDGVIDLARDNAQTYGSSGISSQDRQMAANTARDLYEQMVELANSKIGGNYIYSGHQTDTPPFGHFVELDGSAPVDLEFGLSADATDVTLEILDADNTIVRTIDLGDGVTPGSGGSDGVNTVSWDGQDDGGALQPDGRYTFRISAGDAGNSVTDYATYNGDDGQLSVIVGENVEVELDMDGRNFFALSGGVNLFEAMADLINGLEIPDPVAGSNRVLPTIEQLDQARVQLNTKRTEYRPKLYRLENSETHWANFGNNLEINIGRIENADINKAAVELQALQLAYESTIATAARLIQPGIVNFLS